MISGQKQLSPCPTGERASTVERMVLTRFSRKRRQSLRNFFRRRLLFSSRKMTTNGSLPGNAPPQWLQNTIDLGACTLPTSRWLANRYFVWPSAAYNTQTGRTRQTSHSHNRHAQSPVQGSCVQLKQQRQRPENDGTWKLPPTPRMD